MISVDTLRADAADGMASFDYVARRGAYFPRAMATSSWTVPSLASMWTGAPPHVHGAGRDERRRFTGIRASVPTLAELLGARGYRTGAFVSNPFVARPGTGLARGFDTWRFVDRTTTLPLALSGWPPRGRDRGDARDLVDASLAWLASALRQSFLLWVHVMEPHLPYVHAPAPHPYTRDLVRSYRTGQTWYVGVRDLRAAYQREVAYADRHVLRLLRALDARGLFEDGVVVLVSDHGEELLDHGGLEHGHSHHGEVIDIPLAIAGPGMAPGPRRDLASLADVAPTLRAMVGLAPDGIDLRRPAAPNRVAIAEGNLYYGHARSMRADSTRVIERRRGHTEVFDLDRDPAEVRTRAPTTDELRRFRQAWAADHVATDPAPVVDVRDDALRALGYVE